MMNTESMKRDYGTYGNNGTYGHGKNEVGGRRDK
jgi:hypothetical protein